MKDKDEPGITSMVVSGWIISKSIATANDPWERAREFNMGLTHEQVDSIVKGELTIEGDTTEGLHLEETNKN